MPVVFYSRGRGKKTTTAQELQVSLDNTGCGPWQMVCFMSSMNTRLVILLCPCVHPHGSSVFTSGLPAASGSHSPAAPVPHCAVCGAVQACHGPQSWWRRCFTSSSSTRGSWTFCSAPAPCCCVFWAKVGTRLDREAPPSWVLCLTSSSNFPLTPSICLSSLLFPSAPM